jgi:hypothetical protein
VAAQEARERLGLRHDELVQHPSCLFLAVRVDPHFDDDSEHRWLPSRWRLEWRGINRNLRMASRWSYREFAPREESVLDREEGGGGTRRHAELGVGVLDVTIGGLAIVIAPTGGGVRRSPPVVGVIPTSASAHVCLLAFVSSPLDTLPPRVARRPGWRPPLGAAQHRGARRSSRAAVPADGLRRGTVETSDARHAELITAGRPTVPRVRYVISFGTLAIPILASFNAADQNPSELIRYSVLAVSLIVTAITALLQALRFREDFEQNWRTASALEEVAWEGDLLAGGDEFCAGLFDALEPVVGHPACARAMRVSRRPMSSRRRLASVV